MLDSFTHVGIVVEDIEKSIRFYQEVIGLELKGTSDNKGLEKHRKLLGFPEVHLKAAGLALGDGFILELLQYVEPKGKDARFNRNDIGSVHMAFHVRDIDELYRRTSSKGLTYVNPPTPTYENGKVVRRSSYAQDPDGNWLEFIEVIPQTTD